MNIQKCICTYYILYTGIMYVLYICICIYTYIRFLNLHLIYKMRIVMLKSKIGSED